MPRTLGIDFGERRVGLAISDPLHVIAKPLLTLTRKSDDAFWDELAAILREKEINLIVVGYPVTMRGTSSAQTKQVDEFISELCTRFPLTVETYDERLSTVSAKRALVEQGIKSGHHKELVDQTAACIVLQSFLDARR